MATPPKIFRMNAAIGSAIYNIQTINNGCTDSQTNFDVGDIIFSQDLNNGHCVDCKALREEIKELKSTMIQQNTAIMEAFADMKMEFKKIVVENEANKSIAENFPILTMTDLENIEININEANKTKYVQTFSRYLKGKLPKTLTKILDVNLLLQVNVDGIHNKERLKNYKNFYNALIESIGEQDPEQALRKAITTIKKRFHHQVFLEKKKNQQNGI